MPYFSKTESPPGTESASDVLEAKDLNDGMDDVKEGTNFISAWRSDKFADSIYMVMSVFTSGSPEPKTSPSGVVLMKRNFPLKIPSVHLSK